MPSNDGEHGEAQPLLREIAGAIRGVFARVACNTSGVKHVLSILNHAHEHYLVFMIT
jgi:hypothetical protein